MEILILFVVGIISFGAGIICMVPGAVGFYGWRFWQLMSEAKFTNQNRLYLVRLSTAITTNSLISRTLFWLFRGFRFIGVLLICVVEAIPMLVVGMIAGFLYGAMKISQLTAANFEDEYDTV